MFAIQKPYELRDPIHKAILFDSYEKKFIDHQVLQRLRSISQLGFVSMAYPGAIHSRFLHSLGVMHLAGRIFHSVVTSNKKFFSQRFSNKDLKYLYKVLRLSGLLHDIGHAPYSHSCEYLFPNFDELDMPHHWLKKSKRNPKCSHEDYGVYLIYQRLLKEDKIFDEDTAQDICSLIHHQVNPSPSFQDKFGKSGIFSMLSNIISGEIDVDRMDYLLRDSYFAGVTYGNFDVDRIVTSLSAFDQNGIKLAVEGNAIHTFEDFLLARYHMFLQVYFHKTSLCFDYYLLQALKNTEFEIKISHNIDAYLSLTEDRLKELFRIHRHKFWTNKIFNRIPSKLIRSFNFNSPEESMRKIHNWERKMKNMGYQPFIVQASQYMSQLGQKKSSITNNGKIYLRKHSLIHEYIEPIENNSRLIDHYNEPINIVNLYCLPEELKQALQVIPSEKKHTVKALQHSD